MEFTTLSVSAYRDHMLDVNLFKPSLAAGSNGLVVVGDYPERASADVKCWHVESKLRLAGVKKDMLYDGHSSTDMKTWQWYTTMGELVWTSGPTLVVVGAKGMRFVTIDYSRDLKTGELAVLERSAPNIMRKALDAYDYLKSLQKRNGEE